MGLGEANSKLYYEDFLKVFDEGHKVNYNNKPPEVGFPQVIFGQLSPTEAENNIRKMVAEQVDSLQSVSISFV